MLSAYAGAYKVISDQKYLDTARYLVYKRISLIFMILFSCSAELELSAGAVSNLLAKNFMIVIQIPFIVRGEMAEVPCMGFLKIIPCLFKLF